MICSAPTRADRGRMTLWLQDDLVVIDDVPARVCGGCGETFYDDSIVAKVERLQTGGDRPRAVETVQAPVYRWEDL